MGLLRGERTPHVPSARPAGEGAGQEGVGSTEEGDVQLSMPPAVASFTH